MNRLFECTFSFKLRNIHVLVSAYDRAECLYTLANHKLYGNEDYSNADLSVHQTSWLVENCACAGVIAFNVSEEKCQ